MNRHLNKIIFLSLALMIGMGACKKAGPFVTATSGVHPGLTASATMLNYTQADSASNAVTFTYTPTSFGYQAAVNYNLQVSYNDSNFSKISTYALSGGTKSFTVAKFNVLALGSKYAAGVTDTVLVRVQAIVSGTGMTPGSDTLAQYSDVVKIVVTPYVAKRVITYPFLYVPGAYQGWSPSSAVIAKLYSPGSNSSYEGYVNITDATNGNNDFKITPAPVWDNSYGEVTASTIAYNGGGNFEVPSVGYFLLNVNTQALTWSATLQNWSIIGDAANGWNPGDDIAFDFDATDQILVKTVQLKVGGIKFRMNDAWSVTYGIQKDPSDATGKTDLPISPIGEVPISTSNNDNIPITEPGTYKITLDLRVPSEPVCTLIKQ